MQNQRIFQISLKIVILLTIFLTRAQISWAAGPYMHALLADRYISAVSPNLTPEDRELFINGTIFPDIRYLGVIKRDQTHVKGVTLDLVSDESGSFRQGMLLHSWVDEFRQRYVRKAGIKASLAHIPRSLQDTFLKILEDQILQENYPLKDLNTLIATIPQEEKDYGIPLSALTQWHAGLSVYFTVQPSMILSQLSFFEQSMLNLDVETIKIWSELIPQYAEKKEYQEYVQGMLKAFQSAIEKQAVKK